MIDLNLYDESYEVVFDVIHKVKVVCIDNEYYEIRAITNYRTYQINCGGNISLDDYDEVEFDRENDNKIFYDCMSYDDEIFYEGPLNEDFYNFLDDYDLFDILEDCHSFLDKKRKIINISYLSEDTEYL